MFIRKLFIFFIFFSVSMSSQAECEKWGCIGKITNIYTNADGMIYFGTEYNEKKANCTPVSDVYFTLNPKSENAKEIYSSVLSAYMAGKKIQLRVKEGSQGCELAYVNLSTSI
ncbi:MAG: hypothetical protein ACRC7J_13525 [Vibrio ordalii]|uniref:hypothetical protein n=1 Tax=Vibrio ordalii TaxID=28174 RepID=UPI003F387310